jgi:hypothetical protein
MSPASTLVSEMADLDLPFAEEFSMLSDLSEESPAINDLNPQPVDDNCWELDKSPEEYLRRFKETFATA